MRPILHYPRTDVWSDNDVTIVMKEEQLYLDGRVIQSTFHVTMIDPGARVQQQSFVTHEQAYDYVERIAWNEHGDDHHVSAKVALAKMQHMSFRAS